MFAEVLSKWWSSNIGGSTAMNSETRVVHDQLVMDKTGETLI